MSPASAGRQPLVELRLRLRTAPDLAVVDALARLALAVRRGGGACELRACDDDLALLKLVGLCDAVGSVVEVRREPEAGEEV